MPFQFETDHGRLTQSELLDRAQALLGVHHSVAATPHWTEGLFSLPADSLVEVLAEPSIETVAWVTASWLSHFGLVLQHPRADAAVHERLRQLTGCRKPSPEPSCRSDILASNASAKRNTASEDIFAVLATSGSSGVPKAVALSRRAVCASAFASAPRLGFRRQNRALLALGAGHVGGLAVLVRALLFGNTVVASDKPLYAALLEHDITHASVVPTQLERLLREPLPRPPRLELLLVGGAPCPKPLFERAIAAGYPVALTYGMSETSSQIATSRIGSADMLMLPGVKARTVRGVLSVRSRTLFSAYVGAPSPFEDDGFFRTGDRTALDGDVAQVAGREGDMILCGGENIDPVEVEAALLACDAVREVIVFGLPDDEWGHVIAALVVAQSEDAVRHFIAQLSPLRKPRRYAFVDSLPRTATQKLSRELARATYIEGVLIRPFAE